MKFRRKIITVFYIILVLICKNVYAEDNNIDDNKTDNDSNVEVKHNMISNVYYKSHIQDYGWQDYVSNGMTSGTYKQSKRMESFQIYLDSNIEGSILYKSHIQDYGWEDDWKSNNEITGTEHKSKRLEAIRIKLDGLISESYDIYYRVHVQDYGWLGWAKNGEIAGTIGYSKRLEAIEIKLVEKNTGEPTGNSYIANQMKIKYKTHVQSIGWQETVENGMTAGTQKQSLRIEAIKINVSSSLYSGGVRYMSYIQGNGWEKNWKTKNEISGTVGSSLRLEAIKMELTGELAQYYDIYYRVHIRDYGWLGWTKNGGISGNINTTFRIEAIEIKLIEKNKGEEIIPENSYIEKKENILYSSHVQSIGDTEFVNENEISGTTGKKLRLESFTINLNSNISGDILYQSYIEDLGWETEWKKSGMSSGTSHQSKALNLIRIKLDGELAEKYDVYYRVHSDKYGWLGWSKNGEDAGATCYDIQAIQIRLYLKKDTDAKYLSTTNHYVETGFYRQDGYTYYKDKNGKNATDWITIMNEKYFFNSLGVMIGKNVKKVIDVSSHQGKIDWDTVKKYGNIDGVILRISAGSAYVDSQFARNVSELNRLGIPYGVYIYSYAENQVGTVSDLGTAHEGALEAKRIIKAFKDYNVKLSLPIFYDLEVWENKKNLSWNNDNYAPIIKSFSDTMSAAGYSYKIYTNKVWAESALSNYKNMISWIAQYNHFCTYNGDYMAWQYSSNEIVPGINGGVDVSVWFS